MLMLAGAGLLLLGLGLSTKRVLARKH
jgi:hypothetical protein